MTRRVESRLVPPGGRWRRRLHRIRALRHHAAALLREFRVPIFAFGAVTVLGGFLYGELYRLARGVHIPWIDRPYVMVQLMLLEAPDAVPGEWYLVVFWYALPLVFVVLLGLGAADFIDLFFDRDDSRNAWGEALAMTYSNHVIVLGAGHVGLRVVRDLIQMGLETVVVDHAPSETAREALERLEVPVVMGDGRRAATLRRAGLAQAEAFVACTADDQVNVQAVMRARDAQPDIRIVVRMWDRSFADQMERFMNVHAVLSAADLSAPAFAGAAAGIEITQTLEIAGVEHSTLRLQVTDQSFMAGSAVGDIERDNDLEIVLLRRGDAIDLDPDPERTVRAGDDLVLFARHSTALDVAARNRGRRRSA